MISKIFRNKHFKDGGLYLLGNLFNKAISFITVPIFTRILSTSEYGIVSTYSSYVSILAVVIGLSLGKSIRNAFVDYKEDLNGFISSVFSLSFISFILITVMAIGLDWKMRYISIPLVVMCCIHSFGTYIIQSMIIKYMMEGKSLKRTILLVCPNLVAAILSVFMIVNMDTNKEYGRIIPMFLVVSAFGMVCFISYLLKGKKTYCPEYWKFAVSLSVPLIFHGLSVNILHTSDRTMITAFRNASETGIYSVVYNLSLLSTVVTSSLESVWIPYFTKKMIDNQKKDINNSARVYMELCTIIFCGMLIAAPEALVIFASEKYRGGIGIIAPVILASFFQYLYTFAVNAEYYYKKTKIIATNTFIAAAINLILNFIFIPHFGAMAAAFTTVVAYITSFVVHCAYCKKLDNELFPVSVFIMPTIVVVALTVFQYFTLHNPITRWSIGLAIIAAYTIAVLFKEKKTILKIVR